MHEAGPLLDINQETENVAIDSQNTVPQLRQISATAKKLKKMLKKLSSILSSVGENGRQFITNNIKREQNP